eukprot:6799683-Karenia_brevis.AAC.1
MATWYSRICGTAYPLFGLQPSTEGAGMKEGDTPRSYTSKSENTSLYYARPREFPFDTRSDCGVF